MGLNVSLITFVANALIRSSDCNANFNALNNASSFNGGVPTLSVDSAAITSDGNGNLKVTNGKLGKSATGDMLSAGASETDVEATTAVILQVGGISIAEALSTGVQMLSGGLALQKGSISRDSSFTGTTNGTYNHGLGAVPSIVFPVDNIGSLTWYGASSFTPTTVYIAGIFSFIAFCAAF
jgi:hypothetical protein